MQGSDVSKCTAGSLFHSHSSSDGRRLTYSTSLGEQRGYMGGSGQAPHPPGSSGGLSPLSSADSAQELSEQVWGLLLEALQPFMLWELQSGMGDFWEQVCRRPPTPPPPLPPLPPNPLQKYLHLVCAAGRSLHTACLYVSVSCCGAVLLHATPACHSELELP